MGDSKSGKLGERGGDSETRRLGQWATLIVGDSESGRLGEWATREGSTRSVGDSASGSGAASQASRGRGGAAANLPAPETMLGAFSGPYTNRRRSRRAGEPIAALEGTLLQCRSCCSVRPVAGDPQQGRPTPPESEPGAERALSPGSGLERVRLGDSERSDPERKGSYSLTRTGRDGDSQRGTRAVIDSDRLSLLPLRTAISESVSLRVPSTPCLPSLVRLPAASRSPSGPNTQHSPAGSLARWARRGGAVGLAGVSAGPAAAVRVDSQWQVLLSEDAAPGLQDPGPDALRLLQGRRRARVINAGRAPRGREGVAPGR